MSSSNNVENVVSKIFSDTTIARILMKMYLSATELLHVKGQDVNVG